MNGQKHDRRLRAAWRGGLAAIVSLVWSSAAIRQVTLAGEPLVPRTLVVLEVTEAGTDDPLPCHVYLKDSEGQPVEPSGCTAGYTTVMPTRRLSRSASSNVKVRFPA